MCVLRCSGAASSAPSPIWRSPNISSSPTRSPLSWLLKRTRRTIRHALFGAAGLVENGRCALTNNAWVVDAAELAARFGFAGVHIVNDFEAVAWSLPLMTADDLRMIGGRTPKPGAPMVVLGPGTGLGVAAYIPGNGGGSVVRGEGGHVTMPSSDAREDAIIQSVAAKIGARVGRARRLRERP